MELKLKNVIVHSFPHEGEWINILLIYVHNGKK